MTDTDYLSRVGVNGNIQRRPRKGEVKALTCFVQVKDPL
jgi:hypothetical protein